MRIRPAVERARRSAKPCGTPARARRDAGIDRLSATPHRAGGARFEREAARADELMSPSAKPEQTGSDCNETHWWRAYAKHSAVDGTAHRDKSAGGGSRIRAGDPPRGAVPKQVTHG
jgi:hypothetical protein